MDDRDVISHADVLTKTVLTAIARLHFMIQLLLVGVVLLVIAFLIHVVVLLPAH